MQIQFSKQNMLFLWEVFHVFSWWLEEEHVAAAAVRAIFLRSKVGRIFLLVWSDGD